MLPMWFQHARQFKRATYRLFKSLLYSDLGRVMASIVHDDHMMHFVAQADLNKLKNNLAISSCPQWYVPKRLRQFTLCKYGLASQDLSAAVNLFLCLMKMAPCHMSVLTIPIWTAFWNGLPIIFICRASYTSPSYQPADIQLSLFKA